MQGEGIGHEAARVWELSLGVCEWAHRPLDSGPVSSAGQAFRRNDGGTAHASPLEGGIDPHPNLPPFRGKEFFARFRISARRVREFLTTSARQSPSSERPCDAGEQSQPADPPQRARLQMR